MKSKGQMAIGYCASGRLLLAIPSRLLILEAFISFTSRTILVQDTKTPWSNNQGVEKVGAKGLEPVTSRM
jgi:hypothetical protein